MEMGSDMAKIIWDRLGCYADGTFGDQHLCEKLADMLEDVLAEQTPNSVEAMEVNTLICRLPEESEDRGEYVSDALWWLDQHTPSDCSFELVAGDLILYGH